MLKKDVVKEIKECLENTDLSYREIAKQFNCSTSTISSINNGQTYTEERTYPIRNTTSSLTDNERAFCCKLFKEGYTVKQIHIILSKGSYSTMANVVKGRGEYIYDEVLEKRRQTFDIITTPSEVFINTLSYDLTIHDFVYIKFLSRMNVSLNDILVLYMPLINYPTMFSNYPIKTLDDIQRYIEWGGTKNKIIYWILQVYYNKVNTYNNEKFYYNDININRFLKLSQSLDLQIVKEMLNFETKDNFKQRT